MDFHLIYYNLHFLLRFLFFRCTIFLGSIFLFLDLVFSIDLLTIPHSTLCFTTVAISLIDLRLGSKLLLGLFWNQIFLFFWELEGLALVLLHSYCWKFRFAVVSDWVWEVCFLIFFLWRGWVWSQGRFWVMVMVDYLNYFWVHRGWWYWFSFFGVERGEVFLCCYYSFLRYLCDSCRFPIYFISFRFCEPE